MGWRRRTNQADELLPADGGEERVEGDRVDGHHDLDQRLRHQPLLVLKLRVYVPLRTDRHHTVIKNGNMCTAVVFWRAAAADLVEREGAKAADHCIRYRHASVADANGLCVWVALRVDDREHCVHQRQHH